MRRASGRCAHTPASSATADGSAAARPAPTSRASRSYDSSGSSTSSAIRRAPSRAARPASWSRLVTTTAHRGLPGSSGRTWSGSPALSSTTSTRRSARTDRYSAAASSTSSGTWSGATPRACRKRVSASIGRSGGVVAKPRRSTWSCPSGNRSRTRCPQWTASGLAHPGRAGDRRDHRRRMVHIGLQQGVEPVEVVRAAGERGDVRRQLRGAVIPALALARGCGSGAPGGGCAGVAAEDGHV